MSKHEVDEEIRRLRWCLDFSDTVDWRNTDHPEESLHSYIDLVTWSQSMHLLTAHEAEHLLQEARHHSKEADTVFHQAINLREAIYRIFSALTHRKTPQNADLNILNATLTRGMAQARLTIVGTADIHWGWTGQESALERILWVVARSAAELLTSEKLCLVRECEGPGCGWLFLDLSKNHSRRWCNMETCGNRAKANRHYQRVRQQMNSRSAASEAARNL